MTPNNLIEKYLTKDKKHYCPYKSEAIRQENKRKSGLFTNIVIKPKNDTVTSIHLLIRSIMG